MIHHTGNVVEGNSSPPNSSSSLQLPPSSSIISDRRDVITVANTTNDNHHHHHHDYEDAKIPRSSFSKGFTFFEKSQRNNHQALTLLSPKKSKSESTPKLSVTKKMSLYQHRSLSPPPPSLSLSPSSLSSLLFSPTPPSSSLLHSPSSSTSPPKQPQRKKAATDRCDTYLLSSSLSSSSVSSVSLPEDSAPLSLLLPAESRSFPSNCDKDSNTDDDTEASFSEFNDDDGDVVGDDVGDGVDVGEEAAVTPKVKAAVLPSSSEHQRRKTKKKKKNKNKKKQKQQNYTDSCATRVTFSKKVRVRKIARLIDMDSQDKHATYYSHDEMVQTRNMLRATIRVINEDYQQQQEQQQERKRHNNSTEIDPVQTQIENGPNIDQGQESESDYITFCGAFNDKNCDCCRPIIQNDNKDCEDDDKENDDNENRKSSGDTNYYWNDNPFCLRGLEVEFPTGKQRRRRNKTIARDMVYEEQRYYNTIKTKYNTSTPPTTTSNGNNNKMKGQQELEEEENKDGKVEVEIEEDPVMAIAEVYRIESIPALQRALEIGTNDEFIAHCIYNNQQEQQEQ